MKRFITSAAAACALALPAISHAGAFGIDMGTPISKLKVLEVIDTHGQVSIMTIEVPMPNDEFTSYQVVASTSVGVCKIIAIGKTHESDNDGSATKYAFSTLKAALTSKYGQSRDYDFLKNGSIWNGSNEWAPSIHENDRIFSAWWSKDYNSTTPDDIIHIILEVEAETLHDPHIELTYEFTNSYDCQKQSEESNNKGL